MDNKRVVISYANSIRISTPYSKSLKMKIKEEKRLKMKKKKIHVLIHVTPGAVVSVAFEADPSLPRPSSRLYQ